MARLGVWVALALLTLYLVFFGGGWQGIYTTDLRSISVALAGIVLAIWAAVAWRRPEWQPKSVFLPAIAVCLASLAISTVLSRHPRLGVEYLGYGIVLAALYLLLVRILADPWFRARMATLATALGVVIGGLFVVLVVLRWIDWWGTVGRITVPPLRPDFEGLTFGNPAAVMTMSVLLTSVGVASIGLRSRGRVIASSGLVLLAGVATFLSGSRAGWFGAGIGVLVTAILWLATKTGRAQAAAFLTRVRSTRAGRISTAVALFAVAAAGVVLGPAILLRTNAGGDDFRLGYVTAATRMFVESPIVGTGPGTWVAQRILYTDPPTPDYYIPHAHNVYLQTLAELGVVGALAGIVLIIAVVALIRRAFSNPNQQPWALAAVFATAYFGAHQLLDIYMNFPSVMFAAALPIAWLDATTTQTTTEPTTEPTTGPISRRLRAGAWAAAVIAAAAAVGFLWSVENPAALHSMAVGLANEGKWADALAPAKAAVDADPDIPAYRVTFGLALARAGQHAEASAAFRGAATADGLPESWLNLAAEEALLGHDSDALGAIDQALRLGYQRPAIAFAAGELALSLRDNDRGTDALAWAIATTPSLAADPWWQGAPERTAVFNDVIDLAIERAGDGYDWEIALMAHDADRATKLATTELSTAAGLATTVISAWTNTPAMSDDSARQSVLDQCAAHPFDSSALGWCARLSARAGDTKEAKRYRKWAFTLGYDALASAELRVSTTPLIGRTVEGVIAQFYGTYTYRRPTPWDLLVPSLAHLTFK